VDAAIVIVTRDRWRLLAGALEHLLAEQPGVPVVVVDNGSVEPPPPLPEPVEVVRLDSDQGAHARNVGTRHAGTEFVAFCDDDAWWDAGSLERAVVRMHDAPRLAGVVGRVLIEPGGRLDPVSAEHEATGKVTGFMATALIARSEAFLAAGGYHRRFRIGGEEELLAMRLLSSGWDIAYDPACVLHHRPVSKDHHTRGRRPIWGVRNRLWTAWMRRPLPEAARETVRVLRDEEGNARAFASAARGLPWVLREREVNPPHVERLYR